MPKCLVTMKCLAWPTCKAVHLQNPKNIILSYINMNSIQNKLDSPCILISLHVDILSTAKTRLNYSCLNVRFLIPSFHQPFHFDTHRISGGLLAFARSLISARTDSCLIFKLYHFNLIQGKKDGYLSVSEHQHLTWLKDTINPLQLFIFTNVIRCSSLTLWVGCFIYFKFTRVSSIVSQSLHLYFN